MRILIADDEYLARATLRSLLAEVDLPLEIVGEATDGAELVDLVRRLAPDVAFVDIRMPHLNGLEAIRAGKAASPHTRWFILTGFPEFNYAQEAVRLGVSDYLLKPVDPLELRGVMARCHDDNRRAVAARNRQFARDVSALLHGLVSLAGEGVASALRKSHFTIALLIVDSHLAESAIADRQLEFCHQVQVRIDALADSTTRIALCLLPGGELAIVGAWEPGRGPESKQHVEACFRAAEQIARRSCDRDWVVTVLASPECPSFLVLRERADQLQKLAPLRAVRGIGARLDLAELQELAARPGWQEFASLVVAICRHYRERAYLGYVQALHTCARFLPQPSIAASGAVKRAVADLLSCSTGCQVAVNQGLKVSLQLLEKHGEQLLIDGSREEGQRANMVDRVLTFVDQHYMEDISIGQIAEHLHITPNYLSTLFHKKTGQTFMAYLTQTRMLRARELLADSTIHIQQVAERVGYASARHFTRLFTEYVGCYPSEYRNKLGAEKLAPGS